MPCDHADPFHHLLEDFFSGEMWSFPMEDPHKRNGWFLRENHGQSSREMDDVDDDWGYPRFFETSRCHGNMINQGAWEEACSPAR